VILTEAVSGRVALGIPLASARPSSQSTGRVKDATTDLGVARHAPVPWSEALAAFGRHVLRPAEPDVAGALAALAAALDTEPIALLSCRDGEGVLVRQIFGGVAGLGAALTPQTPSSASATPGDDLSSGFLDGDWPLVLAGERRRRLAGGAGGRRRAATPTCGRARDRVRMLDHAHPGDGEDGGAGPRR
jgi:hypothetical protein